MDNRTVEFFWSFFWIYNYMIDWGRGTGRNLSEEDSLAEMINASDQPNIYINMKKIDFDLLLNLMC